MFVQPCPDNQDCKRDDDNWSDQAKAHGMYTRIKLVFAVALVVVFGTYLKLRPSFSSYIFAIPFHLFAGFLLLCVSIMATEGLLTIDAFRSMIGMCKKTEVHDKDGTCVPLCQNEKKVPATYIYGTTYECIDPNPKTNDDLGFGRLWYDGFLFRGGRIEDDEPRPPLVMTALLLDPELIGKVLAVLFDWAFPIEDV